jgi:hypothetical protein
MRCRLFALWVPTCLLLAACQPDIQTFDPLQVKRAQIAKVEGNRMNGASMAINGTPVGAAQLLAISDLDNRRDIMIPANAPASINVTASDPLGSDSQTAAVAPVPSAGTPPPPNFVIGRVVNPITGAVTFTATGTHIFPGAGAGTTMFQGPPADAERVAPPATFSADSSTFVADGNYTFRFNALPPGDYKLRIHNAAFYGGQSGVSTNQVTVP